MTNFDMPVRCLDGNVNQYISGIRSINIEKAICNGLKRHIKYHEFVSDEQITAYCSKDGQVYLSPSFAQAIWCMAYLVVSLVDSEIVNQEFKREGVSSSAVLDEIMKSNVRCPETTYLEALNDASETSNIFQLVCRFVKKTYNDKDLLFIRTFDDTGDLEQRSNGVYVAAIGFLMAHEAAHYVCDKTFSTKAEYEQYADDKAFDDTYCRESIWVRTSQLGAICALLMGFISNPYLEPIEGYYREDIRLFRQVDKIKDWPKAKMAVAYVLNFWFDTYHDKQFDVHYDNVEETIREIKELFNKQ